MIFSSNAGGEGRLCPIYWRVAEGNHSVRIDGELVPLIPLPCDRRTVRMHRAGEG